MNHNKAMLEKKKERVGIRGKKWEKSIVHEKNCNSHPASSNCQWNLQHLQLGL